MRAPRFATPPRAGDGGTSGLIFFLHAKNVRRKEKENVQKKGNEAELPPLRPAPPGGRSMRSVLDRPGLGERYGVAVNSPNLEEGHALDVMTAAGFAAAELERQAPDAIGLIEARLAPLLWRAKYGRDGVATMGAVALLTGWLLHRPFLAEIEYVRPGMTRIVSARALHEWLSSRCSWCGGTGWQEVTRSGKRVRASRGVRNANLAICGTCKGTGRLRTTWIERCRALTTAAWEVDRGEYVRLWHGVLGFTLLRLRLVTLAPRGPLQSALAAGTVAAK